MIEPYNVVGLVPTFWGIRKREDMQKNIEHIKSLTRAAFWLSPGPPVGHPGRGAPGF